MEPLICDSKIGESKCVFRSTHLGPPIAKLGGKTIKETMGII